MLVDSHCHLDFDAFDDDPDDVMLRARQAGTGCFVTIGIRVRRFARAVAEALPGAYRRGARDAAAAGDPRGARGCRGRVDPAARERARTSLSLGHALSFSGLLAYPEHGALHELARTVRGDRILVETDAPSLPSASLLDQRNEPAHLRHVVQLLAELRGVGADEIARRTSDNFYRIFRRCTRAANRQARRRRHQASSASV